MLTGFLLTVPFQAPFPELDGLERGVYLSCVLLSVLSTGFLIAPVAGHRGLFRAGARPLLLLQAQRLAIAGLALLGTAVASAVWLVFDIVLGRAWGYAMGAGVFAVLVVVWAALPLSARRSVRKVGVETNGRGSDRA